MDTKYLEIIKAPIITEKSRSVESLNQYTFKVDHRASKTEIKDAIEKIFNVEITSISTINSKPKKKKVGRYTGLSNKYKKAIVTLKTGQTIDLN